MAVVQPTFVSRTQGFPTIVANATSFSIPLPSGMQPGDNLWVNLDDAAPTHGTVFVPALPGWTFAYNNPYDYGNAQQYVFHKFINGTEGSSVNFQLPFPYPSSRTGEIYYTAVAYRGAVDFFANYVYGVGINGNNSGGAPVTSWTSPSLNISVPSLVVSLWGTGTANNPTKDGASTLRSASLAATARPFVLDIPGGPGTTPGTTLSNPDAGTFKAGAVSIAMRPLNSAPYAPTLVAPSGSQIIDVGVDNTFYFTFSDPDDELVRPEGQSKYEIRYRVVGAPSWTTVTPSPTSNQFHTFAGGTFTAANYEWQARTYDLAVEPGPWSPSEFFTGAIAPAAPVITDPTVDEVITSTSFDLDWTVTTQTAYQYRRVADDAGSPDVDVVYFDSGPIASSAARTVLVAFPVNMRFEHLQLRVWDGVLWSDWASVRVEVAYTPPPAPDFTVSVDADLGALVIDYDTPAPTVSEPTPTSVDIWIDDGGDIGDERKATGLPVDGGWTYMTPRSGRDYAGHIRVIAYTVDGIPSE